MEIDGKMLTKNKPIRMLGLPPDYLATNSFFSISLTTCPSADNAQINHTGKCMSFLFHFIGCWWSLVHYLSIPQTEDNLGHWRGSALLN